MPIDVKARLIEAGTPRKLAGRIRTKIVKESLRDGGEFWHAKILRKHFKAGASSKYGLRPRTAAYKKRKVLEGKGSIDLVYSGDMKREMLERATIAGSSKKMKVEMSAPSYVTGASAGTGQKFGGKSRASLSGEATRVLQSEEKEIAKVIQDSLVERLEKWMASDREKVM